MHFDCLFVRRYIFSFRFILDTRKGGDDSLPRFWESPGIEILGVLSR